MKNTEKFTNKAEIYSTFRPDYPDKLITDFITDHRLDEYSIVADIGSGTGIMAKKLLDYNLKVFAVEPNEEMRKIAETQLSDNPKFKSVAGTAEKTTLGTQSVDFITVAQAFHWFDAEIFKKECQRILKPFGKVSLVSNRRDTESEIIQEIIALYTTFCPDFHGFSEGFDNSPSAYENFFLENHYTLKSYHYPLTYDKRSFIGRHLSASYAPTSDDKIYPQFIEAFGKLFNNFNKNDVVTLPNITQCYCGLVKNA